MAHAQRQNGAIAIQSHPWFSHFYIYIGDVSDTTEHVVVIFILRLPMVLVFDNYSILCVFLVSHSKLGNVRVVSGMFLLMHLQRKGTGSYGFVT